MKKLLSLSLSIIFLSACTTSSPSIDLDEIDRVIPTMEIIDTPPIQTRISKNEVIEFSGTTYKDTINSSEPFFLHYKLKNLSNLDINISKPNVCATSFELIKDGITFNHPLVGYIDCATSIMLSPFQANGIHVDSINMNYHLATLNGGNFEIKITHHYVEKGKISIGGFKFHVLPPTEEELKFRTFDTLSIVNLRMNLGKELIQEYPNNKRIEWIEHSMATILFEQKRYSESIKMLNKLISRKSSSDHVKRASYATLAKIYRETKQKKKTIKMLSKTFGEGWSKERKLKWYNET